MINLVAFCDESTKLVDEGRAEDFVYLDFIKTFVAVSYSILIGKLTKYRLGK